MSSIMLQSCYYRLSLFCSSCFLFLLSKSIWNCNLSKYLRCFVHVFVPPATSKHQWHWYMQDNCCTVSIVWSENKRYEPCDELGHTDPMVLLMNSAPPPHPSVSSSKSLNTFIHPSTCIQSYSYSSCSYQSVGVKPHKSTRNPAAWVLTLH